MTLTIHKGKHRPRWWWLRWPFYFHVQSIERTFIFDFSAIYELANGDQEDHNKLFGISYTLNDHKESVRIGWRYSIENNSIILSAYAYVNGERIMTDVCNAVANRKYLGRIYISDDYYRVLIYQKEDMRHLGSATIHKKYNKSFGYKLGLYFGGNQTAPHDITIEISKL